MKKFYSLIVCFLLFQTTLLFAQNFTASWPMANDSLAIASGNVSAPGIYINSALFRTSRVYGATGLTGSGTAGLTAHPSCNATYDSVGTITPYMQINLVPNAGSSASVNAFSFKVKAGTLTSANMVISAGYSTNNGATFTGFEISKNNTPITPTPSMTGTSLATDDSLVLSAPALVINAGDTLKIRIIYWKNANNTTNGNPITIGAISLVGTTTTSSTPIINIPNPSILNGFTYIFGAGPSAQLACNISGSNLSSNITVTAPSSYEVSATSGGGFGNTATLTQVGGTASGMIYVRLKSGLAVGTYNESISISSTGATSQAVGCTGSVVAPPSQILNASPSSLSGFTYALGSGPSASQSINISGSNLLSDVMVMPAGNYEVSLSQSSGYSSMITITPASGTLASTMVYLRLKSSLSAGTYTENISVTSSGLSQTVTVTGTVTNVLPNNGFVAVWYFANDSLAQTNGRVTAPGAHIDPSLFRTSRVYGATGLTGSGTAGLTAHPACNATYDSVGTITPYMQMTMIPNVGYSASVDAFSFKVKAGTLSSANMVISAGYSTDNGVTFTGFNITKNNTPITPVPGMTGTPLATDDSLVLSAPALVINAGDMLKIRIIYWKNANNTTNGNPITIGSISLSGTTNYVGVTPSIAMPVPATLSGWNYILGNGPSGVQSFTVSAFNLNADLIATAPSSYEISSSATSGFGSTVTLTPVSGSVASTMIYARLKAGLIVGTYNEDVTITSAGANPRTVNCQGSVSPIPPPAMTVSASSLSGFSYQLGAGPSSEQMFNVSGINLTTNINVSVSADYEVSLMSGTGFSSTVSLTPTTGSVAQSILYVRMKAALAVGTYNGNITITTTGANDATVIVSGIVYPAPPAGTTSYTETFALNTLGNLGTSYYNDTFSTVAKWGLWTRNNVGLTNANGMVGSGDTRCPKFRTSVPGTYVETPTLRGVYSISYSVSESAAVTDTLTLSDGGTLNNQYIYNVSSVTTPPTYLTVPAPIMPTASNNGHYRFGFGSAVATHYLDNIKFVFLTPTSQASVVTAVKNAAETEMTINWTRPNNGQDNQGSIVFVGEGNFIPPVTGTSYIMDTVYGHVTSALGSFYSVYSDTGNSVHVTGLTPGVAYKVYVLEYNGIPGQNDENYNTQTPAFTETCGSFDAYVSEKRTTLNGASYAVDYTLQGTADATVSYDINGGATMQVTLTNGTATIHLDDVIANTTLHLLSISKGLCSNSLSVNSDISITPITINSKPDVNGFNAYPNPSNGGQLKVKMTDADAGKYLVRITSTTGHIIYTEEIQHAGGTSIYTFKYGSVSSIGLYNVEIIDTNKHKKSVQSIIIVD